MSEPQMIFEFFSFFEEMGVLISSQVHIFDMHGLISVSYLFRLKSIPLGDEPIFSFEEVPAVELICLFELFETDWRFSWIHFEFAFNSEITSWLSNSKTSVAIHSCK